MDNGDLQVITDQEFYHFFRNNLRIRNKEVAHHVASFMVRFANAENLRQFFEPSSPSEKFDKIWRSPYKRQTYDSFTTLGDSNLWFCGFNLTYVSKQRKASLGTEDYIKAGQAAYDFAVSVGNQVKDVNPRVSVVSKLGSDFRTIAGEIFDLKRRTDIGIYALSERFLTEICQTYYRGLQLSVYKLNERSLLRIV